MSFSLNKIQLIGNLGQDAENRVTTNNTEVTSFSIATTHSYKGKDGNWVNETTWHNCVLFGASDFFKSNLKKGSKWYVEGRLNKRDYENKDGQKVYVTEVLVDKFNLILLSESASIDTQSSQPEATKPDDEDLPF